MIESDIAFPLVRRHCSALLLILSLGGAWAASADGGSRPGTAPGIVVIGDSLSAEYGLKRGTGWVALLQERLATEKHGVQVVNASISGDTTAGGLNRLPALLAQHKPAIVVIELGGNDALRGLPLGATRNNLKVMAETAQAAGAKVLLIGMQVPPNYGQDYTKQFFETFASVARETKSALVPFLLKGIADAPNAETLFQADRIHPVEAAHPTILNNVWPALKRLLP